MGGSTDPVQSKMVYHQCGEASSLIINMSIYPLSITLLYEAYFSQWFETTLLTYTFVFFPQVPFDVSLPAIFNLERLFDLANGCIVSVGSLFNWVVSIIP